ncbi:MAG: LPS-assembly protein LptD, partial [Candidatus Binataceae bacterium]
MVAVLVTAAVAVSARSFAQQAGGFSSSFSSQHQGPVDVTGQHFVYDYKTDSFVVTGDAVVVQNRTTLTADEVDLKRRQRVMHAAGNVRLFDPLGRMTASSATLNLDDETAHLTDGKILSKDRTYRLEGKAIDKLEGQRYTITDGFFTTCGCSLGTPEWSITGSKIDVHLGDSGVAHDAKFNVLGYPVLYLPYMTFPADTDRHSGFLSPRVGESGLRGFQLLEPYYWAINKSSDATIAMDLETSQRVGLLGEYRLITGTDDYFALDSAYYNETLRSEANRLSDIIDNQIADPHIPVNRYDIIGMMRQHLTPALTVYGDATSLSDSLELREMNVWTLSRSIGSGTFFPNSFASTRNAVSDFGMLYSSENGYAQMQGVWNQDLIQPQKFALQDLPQITISGRHELLGGLAYADFDVEGDNFYRNQGIDGLRLDLNPRLTVPFRLGDYFYGWGTLAMRETAYDVSGHQIDVTPVGTDGRLYNNALSLGALAPGGLMSREMIYGNAGIGSEIEKVYDLNWKYVEKIKHTIEPFVTYAYVPSTDQSDYPLFDQVDRLEPRSLITYGFTSRVIAKLPPILQSHANESQEDEPEPQDISPFRARGYAGGSNVEELARFSLIQAYDTDHAIAVGAQRFSDVQATAMLLP